METIDISALLGSLRKVLDDAKTTMDKAQASLGHEKFAEAMAVVEKSNAARERGDIAEADAIIAKFTKEENAPK